MASQDCIYPVNPVYQYTVRPQVQAITADVVSQYTVRLKVCLSTLLLLSRLILFLSILSASVPVPLDFWSG